VDRFDRYESTQRVRLHIVGDADVYLKTIRRGLHDFVRAGIDFDLCIYNAGMDPFDGCCIGGLQGIDRDMLAEREGIVFAWCRSNGTPIAFVLAGGYVGPGFPESVLVDLHRLTLSGATT